MPVRDSFYSKSFVTMNLYIEQNACSSWQEIAIERITKTESYRNTIYSYKLYSKTTFNMRTLARASRKKKWLQMKWEHGFGKEINKSQSFFHWDFHAQRCNLHCVEANVDIACMSLSLPPLPFSRSWFVWVLCIFGFYALKRYHFSRLLFKVFLCESSIKPLTSSSSSQQICHFTASFRICVCVCELNDSVLFLCMWVFCAYIHFFSFLWFCFEKNIYSNCCRCCCYLFPLLR